MRYNLEAQPQAKQLFVNDGDLSRGDSKEMARGSDRLCKGSSGFQAIAMIKDVEDKAPPGRILAHRIG